MMVLADTPKRPLLARGGQKLHFRVRTESGPLFHPLDFALRDPDDGRRTTAKDRIGLGRKLVRVATASTNWVPASVDSTKGIWRKINIAEKSPPAPLLSFSPWVKIIVLSERCASGIMGSDSEPNVNVRFWERVGVRFLRAARQTYIKVRGHWTYLDGAFGTNDGTVGF
jgi:hypothetical protein